MIRGHEGECGECGKRRWTIFSRYRMSYLCIRCWWKGSKKESK
jgi:hypothetical protein